MSHAPFPHISQFNSLFSSKGGQPLHSSRLADEHTHTFGLIATNLRGRTAAECMRRWQALASRRAASERDARAQAQREAREAREARAQAQREAREAREAAARRRVEAERDANGGDIHGGGGGGGGLPPWMLNASIPPPGGGGGRRGHRSSGGIP